MRLPSSLLGLGVLLSAQGAAAGGNASGASGEGVIATAGEAARHPLAQLVEAERPRQPLFRGATSRAVGLAPRPPDIAAPRSALDCEHAVHDITLDPMTGETAATLELRVRARGKPLGAVGFTFDEGLRTLAVSADGRTARASEYAVAPVRAVEIEISPPLQPGESTILRVAYGGTLSCGSLPGGGAVLCTKGQDFSYFGQQSVYPLFFDPADRTSTELDLLTREITLRVPWDVDVIATGEHAGDVVLGNQRVSRWSIDRPLSRVLGLYAFAGKLGRLDVPQRSVPTSFVFPAPELPVDQRLTAWSSPVLDFVERISGTPLPFRRSLTLVRLPSDVGDPGTATFGMTLLSESYARAGETMHEETWAHENSHLFWGIVVPERDPTESRMMSEGIATLAEIDYTWASHYASQDRDLYLARRFVPIAMDLGTVGKSLPPIVLTDRGWDVDAARTPTYMMWAYTKPAATLDHLRVTLGEEVFATGLAGYVARCSYVGCSPADFRTVLEEASGKDLHPFFERWVTGSSRPRVTVGFTRTPGGADVELTKDDTLPMTLELWLRLDGGRVLKQRVDLGGRSTRIHLATPEGVRAVATSPRHDLMVESRSAVDGDIDFDGETDGVDLLRCSRLVGRVYRPPNGLGLSNLEETFDPRCDANADFRIDEEDIDLLGAAFGKLREP